MGIMVPEEERKSLGSYRSEQERKIIVRNAALVLLLVLINYALYRWHL